MNRSRLFRRALGAVAGLLVGLGLVGGGFAVAGSHAFTSASATAVVAAEDTAAPTSSPDDMVWL